MNVGGRRQRPNGKLDNDDDQDQGQADQEFAEVQLESKTT